MLEDKTIKSLMDSLSKLTDEEYESLKKNIQIKDPRAATAERLKMFDTFRAWEKLRRNEHFRDKVQNVLAKSTYEYFNKN